MLLLGKDTRTQIIFITLLISYNFNNTVLSGFCVLEGTHSVIQYLDFTHHELHDSYRCAIIIITIVGLGDLIISVFCESISLLLTVDDFWNA